MDWKKRLKRAWRGSVAEDIAELRADVALLRQHLVPPHSVQSEYAELNFLHKKIAADWHQFVEPYLGEAMLFRSQGEIRQHMLGHFPPFQGLCMEFGTGWMESMRFFSAFLESTQFQFIYGFDTFEGLPEDWAGTSTGKGSFNNAIPDDLRSNVKLIKGLVQDTVPPFLAEQNLPIRFMHMDLDLYAPTRVVLEAALPYMRPGTAILFDEMFGYAGWRHGEFKAWQEVIPLLKARNLSYRYKAFTYAQALVIITDA